MADFLAARMYRSFLDTRQLIILAAYILFQAKEHVEGCGGDSHIAVLNEKGLSGRVDSTHVEKLTNLINTADQLLAEQLLSCANLKLKKRELKRDLAITASMIETFRKNTAQELKERSQHSTWLFGPAPTNDLGIPKPYKIDKGIRRLISGK